MRPTQLLVEEVPRAIGNAARTSSKRVAIVDDAPDIRLVYSLTLEHAGHKIALSAASGEDVVREIHNGGLSEVDVMIMDYLMGDMTGVGAAKEVLRCNPRIKIFIASGEDKIENEVRAAGLGYLKKPLSKQDLLECIEQRCPFNSASNPVGQLETAQWKPLKTYENP